MDMGADDYITKPFGVMEMVSRVKAVLRRVYPKQGDGLLQVGDLVVNLKEHRVCLAGETIQLTAKEFDLLKLLLSHPGEVFNREQLRQKVWNADNYSQTRTVDMHIRTLRQKLGEYGRMIETVRGVGYRMENGC